MTRDDRRQCGCPAAEPVYECDDPDCGCGLEDAQTGDCVCGHHLDDHLNGDEECLVEIRRESDQG